MYGSEKVKYLDLLMGELSKLHRKSTNVFLYFN